MRVRVRVRDRVGVRVSAVDIVGGVGSQRAPAWLGLKIKVRVRGLG